MKEPFVTTSGIVIDLSLADQVKAVRLVNSDDVTDFEFGVVATIEHKDHILATTGKDKQAAGFHADAIAISLGLKVGGEQLTASRN